MATNTGKKVSQLEVQGMLERLPSIRRDSTEAARIIERLLADRSIRINELRATEGALQMELDGES